VTGGGVGICGAGCGWSAWFKTAAPLLRRWGGNAKPHLEAYPPGIKHGNEKSSINAGLHMTNGGFSIVMFDCRTVV